LHYQPPVPEGGEAAAHAFAAVRLHVDVCAVGRGDGQLGASLVVGVQPVHWRPAPSGTAAAAKTTTCARLRKPAQARRALKRRLFNVVYRIMKRDQRN